MVKEWLLEEESGQGMVEYGLILILISVLAMAAIGTIGKNINSKFALIASTLT